MLRTGRVSFFSGIFISKKTVRNMKLAFTNVSFRHNSACVIQKWLKFRRVIITVRLAYILSIFPNGSKIIELLFNNYTRELA